MTCAIGKFYVVATPIGNLADVSQRAVQVLSMVDCILAEDTRHSKRLLNHYAITTKCRSCHQHNEASLLDWVIEQLQAGRDLALISDAGTPLISDPGFVLVRGLREAALPVVSVPGPSAIIAALSIAGLPSERFVYDGFLPNKATARREQLSQYRTQTRTIVLLESAHRIVACVSDIVAVLGGDRQVVIARELTKRYETVLAGSATQVAEALAQDVNQTRGEFVLLLAGAAQQANDSQALTTLLPILLAQLPVKQAVSLAVEITGERKNEVYELALNMKKTLKVK